MFHKIIFLFEIYLKFFFCILHLLARSVIAPRVVPEIILKKKVNMLKWFVCISCFFFSGLLLS